MESNKTNKFILKDGFIEVSNDWLNISDKAHRDRYRLILVHVFTLIYAVATIGRGYSAGEKIWLYLGMLILAFWIWSFIFRFNRFKKVINKIAIKTIIKIIYRKDQLKNVTTAELILSDNYSRLVKIEGTSGPEDKFSQWLSENGVMIP